MQRIKRHPDRFLILAQRARQIGKGDATLVGELYAEHAAICESKAAQMLRSKKSKRRLNAPKGETR